MTLEVRRSNIAAQNMYKNMVLWWKDSERHITRIMVKMQ